MTERQITALLEEVEEREEIQEERNNERNDELNNLKRIFGL